MTAKKGKLYVVGIGPGHHDHMTYRAKQVIGESEVVVGYDTYISLVEDLINGKEVYRYPMTQEVDRANQAIQFAEEGKIVSLVSSGDPGIYGMIGLIYEILSDKILWGADLSSMDGFARAVKENVKLIQSEGAMSVVNSRQLQQIIAE